MQGVNKFAIGPAIGDQPSNNYQLRTPPVRVTPPVRSVSTLSRSSQVLKPERVWNTESHLVGRQMSYLPTDRPYRSIRDQRDDAIGINRTDDGMEWNHNHSVARNDPGSSAFRTIAFHHRVHPPPRAPEQLSQHSEREWRRPISNNVHRPRMEFSHTGTTASFPTDQIQSWSSADPNSPVSYRPWNSRFPSVSQINEHHQLQRTSNHPGAPPREVQAISMSSSNGSSTCTASPSHNKVVVGEKRQGEAISSEPIFSPRPESASKRFKASPVSAPTTSQPKETVPTQPKPTAVASSPASGRFDMLDLLCSATLGKQTFRKRQNTNLKI